MSAPDIAAKLADRAQDVCEYLLPNGVRKGREWKAGGVEGHEGESLGVVLSGSKAGRWADFSGEAKGDMIGLWMACREVDAATALREAEEFLGLEQRPRTNGYHLNGHAKHEAEREICIAPDDVPGFHHPKHGNPSKVWTYRNAEGQILGYVCRFDPDGGRKQILPRTYSLSDGWQWKGWNKPRPLYGLDKLAARPAAPVLVVEGEKSADAGSGALSAYVVVSWLGGCPGVPYADWTPLKGRNIAIWPDADDAGRAAARAIAVQLAEPVRIIDPDGMPDGWDVADAVGAGMTPGQIIKWCKDRAPKEPALYLPDRPPLVSDYTPDHPDMIENEPPEPVDIFTKHPLPPLRYDDLPPTIADFVFDQSKIIGTDPCILAVSCLVSIAAVCHDSIFLLPQRHNTLWKERARLWGAFVGDPSVKKTPAVARAVSRLKKINVDMAEQSAQETEIYKRQLKAHEAIEREHARYKDQHGDIHPPPVKPIMKRIIVQDSTTEAVQVILKDNPGGLMALYDELSGWFGSMDAYRSQGSKDTSFWLETYNGGSKAIDRIGRESFVVPNMSTCVLGGIQPAAMQRIAADMVDDGLLQRFMIVCAQRGMGIGEDREPDRIAEERYREVIDWLSSERGKGEPVRMSEGALRVMQSVLEQLETLKEIETFHAKLISQLGKWSGLFGRLCLTYHAIHCAAMKTHVEGEISTETAQRVARFMFDYLFEHTRYFYDDILGEGWSGAFVKWIAGHVLAHGLDVITLRDIKRVYRRFEQLTDAKQRQVMGALEYTNWLIPVDPARVGMPVITWNVNSLVHERFKARAAPEAASRQSVREIIKSKETVKSQRNVNGL